MFKQRHSSWYPVSILGLIVTSLYALVPPYIVYAQTTDVFPEHLRMPVIGAMLFISVCMLVCRYTGQKPFHAKRK